MYKIEAACISHMGYVRGNNEDNFYFGNRFLDQEHGSMTEPLTEFISTGEIKAVAVFDGMGGENAGEVASHTAAKAFSKECHIQKISKSALWHMAESLNAQVCRKAEQEKLGQIGTTATILFFDENYAYVTNVGDSPAFIMRNDKLKFISRKHTNEEFLRLSNIKNRRPALTQFLGIPKEEMAIEPYIAGMELQAGDLFLICSDGLTDMVSENEIWSILKKDTNMSDTVMNLLHEALLQGGRDNITIICCKVV